MVSKSNTVTLKEFLDSKIDCGELFVECLNTVGDDLGVYTVKGRVYEVIDMVEDAFFFIEGEDCTVRFKRNDSDFRLLIQKGR